MSEPMPAFTLLRPTTLGEALTLIERHTAARLVAGGTDLVVNMRRGLVETDTLIDITGVPDLKRLEVAGAGITIGAGVTLAALAGDPRVRKDLAAIAQSAEVVAGPGHRTCATVGGNLCLDTRCIYYNQSHWWRKSNNFCLKHKGETCHVAPQGNKCRAAFSGDLAPALIALEAEAEIAGPAGSRRLPLAGLYIDDGASHLALRPGEIVVSVHVPMTGWRSAYAKARVRDSIDFPLAGVAVAMRRDTATEARLRIAITGTDSRPLLLEDIADPILLPLDDATLTRLDKLVQKQVTPMRTTTSAAHYRRLAAAALAKRLIAQIASEISA